MDSLDELIKSLDDSGNSLNDIPAWARILLNGFKLVCVELKNTNAELKKTNGKLNEEISNLRDENAQLREIIDNQEQYSRRNCLLIHGVAETQREKTDAVVLDIFQNQLGIPEEAININYFERSHRLGKVRSTDQGRRGSKRPIIEKFTSYRTRNEVFYNKKKLKGSNVVITENLTKKRYSLLKASLDVLGRHSCWTKDGRILTKKNNEVVQIKGWSADGNMELVS